MKIAYWGNGSASEQWRREHPAKYLNQIDGFEMWKAEGGITEEAARWADVYVLQGTVDIEGLVLLSAYQGEYGKKIVIEQDDRIEVEDSNPHKKQHDLSSATAIIKKMMSFADMVTTSTPKLASELKSYNQNVVVLPNYLDLDFWDNKIKLVNTSDQIRIGWAGSITHIEDIKLILPAAKRIQHEFPQVRFIFMGDPRISEHLEGLKAEVQIGVKFPMYPDKLNSLRLDFALAPLRNSKFNECKSNIKFLEYAIHKIPGIYSPTVYNYSVQDGKTGLIANTDEQWYLNMRNLIVSKNLREDIKSLAYSYVRSEFNLKNKISKWVDAYSSLTK